MTTNAFYVFFGSAESGRTNVYILSLLEHRAELIFMNIKYQQEGVFHCEDCPSSSLHRAQKIKKVMCGQKCMFLEMECQCRLLLSSVISSKYSAFFYAVQPITITEVSCEPLQLGRKSSFSLLFDEALFFFFFVKWECEYFNYNDNDVDDYYH